METPQIGQRWLVDTDASLGLGIVIECEGRSISLEFPATGDIRQYAIKYAPLTRVLFSEGDTISTDDGLTTYLFISTRLVTRSPRHNWPPIFN